MGGYGGGYYRYMWGEGVDRDGFEGFKEDGLLEEGRGSCLGKKILEKGG